MTPKKLLIFDLDGTLIDSLGDLTAALNHVLNQTSRPMLPRDEVRKLVGKGARSLLERALVGGTPNEVDKGLQIFLEYNFAHIAVETRPYPGALDTLEALRAKGFELCVLSNKNVDLCREVLARLGMDALFADIFGGDSFPFKKPSPEAVKGVLREFGVWPREAVLIGDSINDIAAGVGAGVVTIGCSYGYGERSELVGADYVVAKLADLLKILS